MTEKIILYLDEDLELKQTAEFEEQLCQDGSIVEKLLEIQSINEYLKELHFEEFSQSVKSAFHTFKSKEYPYELVKNIKPLIFAPEKWYRSLYKLAASVIVIVGISLFVYSLSYRNSNNTQKLFAKYYSSYQLNGQYRSSSGEQLNYFQLACNAYSRKDYSLAVNYFDKITGVNKTVLFYKGIAHIECNELSPAIHCLELVSEDPENIFTSQCHWYLALIYLKINCPDLAINHLDWLITKMQYNNFYGNRASSILSELNSK